MKHTVSYHFKILSFKAFVVSTLITMLLFVIFMPPAGFIMKFVSYLIIFLINIFLFTGKAEIDLTDSDISFKWLKKPLFSKLQEEVIRFDDIKELSNSGNIAGEKLEISLHSKRKIGFVIIDTVSDKKEEFINLFKEKLQANR